MRKRETPVIEEKKPTVEFLNTGSGMLNLALSGSIKNGGWARGRIINIVGDGSSGKTLLALEACFHAIRLQPKSKLFPDVKKIFIVYNNIEGVMDFNLAEMFGKDFEKNIEFIRTETSEEFGRDYLNRVKELKSGEFLLYILDSMDATQSEASQERMNKSLKTGKKIEGTYGMEKAKYFSSSFFNSLCNEMKNKDATLIIISQVRANIGVTFGEKYYRTGGKSLDFYTHQVCWLAVKQKIEHKNRKIGVIVKARIKRNKCYKPFREVEFPILFDHGIDDIGAIVDYVAGNLAPRAREKIIQEIEVDNSEKQKLINDAQELWDKEERESKVIRKKKYE